MVAWLVGRKRSFGYAINGVRTLYRETNARIHALATVLVIALGACVGLRPLEWTLLAVAATVVWVAEALNTALEVLSDATCPEHDPLIGVVKDVAAGRCCSPPSAPSRWACSCSCHTSRHALRSPRSRLPLRWTFGVVFRTDAPPRMPGGSAWPSSAWMNRLSGVPNHGQSRRLFHFSFVSEANFKNRIDCCRSAGRWFDVSAMQPLRPDL